jgi:hypothetical protein
VATEGRNSPLGIKPRGELPAKNWREIGQVIAKTRTGVNE